MALAAVKGEHTVAELAAEDGVHPAMIHSWKKALLEGVVDIFERGEKKTEVDEETVIDLHGKIGGLAVTNGDRFLQPPAASRRPYRTAAGGGQVGQASNPSGRGKE